MAKLLRFRLSKRRSRLDSAFSDSTLLVFVPINKEVVVNTCAKTVRLRLPEAWLPFVRWSNATSTNTNR